MIRNILVKNPQIYSLKMREIGIKFSLVLKRLRVRLEPPPKADRTPNPPHTSDRPIL